MFEGIQNIGYFNNLRVLSISIEWYNVSVWICVVLAVSFGILALLHDFTELCQNNFEQFSELQPDLSELNTGNCEYNQCSTVRGPNEFFAELNSLIREFKNEETFQIFCTKFSILFSELFPINSSNISPQFLTLILKQIILMKQSDIKILQIQEISKMLLCKLGVSKYTLKTCYSELCKLNEATLRPEIKEFLFSERNRLQSIIYCERMMILEQIKQSFINGIKRFKFAIETIINF
ncbi:hypothetical protein FG386_002445 [Cryptosporidium ryanae]|uniref:uncharacterized protein n=1 Tax=Cryptosporidium ryanae TaxID=515981 RepID=UPI00351A6263|nr:hypothetical protein FG386_002445 [Cryptosporidium ryanae]